MDRRIKFDGPAADYSQGRGAGIITTGITVTTYEMSLFRGENPAAWAKRPVVSLSGLDSRDNVSSAMLALPPADAAEVAMALLEAFARVATPEARNGYARRAATIMGNGGYDVDTDAGLADYVASQAGPPVPRVA